jgi:hypothetical protein
MTRALEHLAALLRADEDQKLWIPLADFALYGVSDRLRELGRLTLVKLTLGAVAGWLERFPAGKAQEPDWRRERCSLLDGPGDVLVAQGDLAGALAAYRESLEVMRRLAALDPTNAVWQKDVAYSRSPVARLRG